HLYTNSSEAEKNEDAIRLAVTLSEATGPLFSTASDGNVKNLLDRHNPTEVFRRLSGFVAMVDKLLKPLVAPIDEARLAHDARERANFVIERIASHLACYHDFYVQRYMAYVFHRTDGLTMIRLFRDTLDAASQRGLLEQFDPSAGFLEG